MTFVREKGRNKEFIMKPVFGLAVLAAGLMQFPSPPVQAILIRPDREDAKYLELATKS